MAFVVPEGMATGGAGHEDPRIDLTEHEGAHRRATRMRVSTAVRRAVRAST